MIRKAFLGRIVGGLLLLGALSTASAAELRSLQLSATADAAVVKLALTNGSAARVFTLERPARAVIDLPNTHVRHGMPVPAPAGLVSAVRLGPRPGGTLRVVVQLRSRVA